MQRGMPNGGGFQPSSQSFEIRPGAGIRRPASWNLPNPPEEKFVRGGFAEAPMSSSRLTSSLLNHGFLPTSGSWAAAERNRQNTPNERASESWRTSSRPPGPGGSSGVMTSDSWAQRQEPISRPSSGIYTNVMKRVMETVIPRNSSVPKQNPVPRPNIPFVSNSVSSSTSFEKSITSKSASESGLTRKPAFERGVVRKPAFESGVVRKEIESSDPIPQANLANDDEQEKLERIKAELARMKREDERAYELLLDVVNATKDPSSGGKEASHLANASPDIMSLSTNKLIMRALYGQPVSAPKADGKAELPQSSASEDSLVSNSAPAVSLKPSDNAKVSNEKTLPSTTLPPPVPPSSTQPRWESWRNPSSRESLKPSNGGTAPHSDSWRSNTSGSSNSSSWRSDSKSTGGSSSLKAQAPFTRQLPGNAGGLEPQRGGIPQKLMRPQTDNRRGYGNSKPFRR